MDPLSASEASLAISGLIMLAAVTGVLRIIAGEIEHSVAWRDLRREALRMRDRDLARRNQLRKDRLSRQQRAAERDAGTPPAAGATPQAPDSLPSDDHMAFPAEPSPASAQRSLAA